MVCHGVGGDKTLNNTCVWCVVVVLRGHTCVRFGQWQAPTTQSSSPAAAPGGAPAGLPNLGGLDFGSLMNNPMMQSMLNNPAMMQMYACCGLGPAHFACLVAGLAVEEIDTHEHGVLYSSPSQGPKHDAEPRRHEQCRQHAWRWRRRWRPGSVQPGRHDGRHGVGWRGSRGSPCCCLSFRRAHR